MPQFEQNYSQGLSMTQPVDHKARVLASCDISIGDSGHYYFWISGSGAYSAYDLRIIADELDRRNQEWDENIAGYMATHSDCEGLANHS